MDFYDGLRAWDLGQKQVAAGIWVTAANWGDARAMQRLAELYEAGDSVPKDNGLACFWHSLAEKRKNPAAPQPPDQTCQSLTATDLATVQSAVAGWKQYALDAAQEKGLETALSQQEHKQSERDLILALNSNNLKAAQDALNNGVSGSATLEDGTPILFLGVAAGNSEIVSALIAHGANANAALPDGRTALHIAAVQGSQAVANALANNGASAAIQDSKGVWPFEYAAAKHFDSLAGYLKSRRDADIAGAVAYLVAAGYLPEGALDNASLRDLAVRMYQAGRDVVSSTGALDAPTLAAIQSDISGKRALAYKFVIRYGKDQKNWYDNSEGSFAGVADARAAAMELCKKEGGTKCKFNFAPPGGCIAVARPDAGEFRVSRPLLDKVQALADAMRQCREDTDNCTEDNFYCAGPG